MRVVRYQVRVPEAKGGWEFGRVETREQADREMEGEGGEGDKEKEEEILEDEGLGLQDCGVGRRWGDVGVVGGRGWERELFDARPGQVDVEEEEENAEAEDRALVCGLVLCLCV